MILKQFYLNCLAHASYLVGDERDAYRGRRRSAARRRSVPRVRRASTACASRTSSSRTSTPISSPATSSCAIAPAPRSIWARPRRPSTRSRRSHDGDVVEFGRVRLTALETPGHTAESISILVYDLDRSATEPHAVLTGDTLFVGDVGRPDLRVALGWSASDLGGLLYDSLRTKLLTLPDTSLVYPGAWRRLAVRQGAEQGDVLDDRRAAALELRAAADEQGGVRRARHRRSTRRAAVFHLRRGAEQQGTADARRDARARGEPADARSGAGAAVGRRADSGRARSGGVRRGAPRREHQHRSRRPVRHVGRHGA